MSTMPDDSPYARPTSLPKPSGMLAQLMAQQAPKKRSGVGSMLGDIAFALLTGAPSPGRQRYNQELAQYDQGQSVLRKALLDAEIAAAEPVKPQGVALGNGGFAEYTPGTGLNVLREPTAQEPPAVQIARAAGLAPGTPQWQAALTAAVPGYSNTQPVLDAKAAAATALADRRASNSAALKAQPTYAQRHPKASGGGARKAPKPPAGFILD